MTSNTSRNQRQDDLSAAETLALQFEELACSRLDRPDHSTILTAFMVSIGAELSSIECCDCRKLAAQDIKRMLPGVIASALAAASERFANVPLAGHAH